MKNFLFFLFLYSSLIAQIPSYSNEFLSVGVDARAFAMGNSIVANQKDVYSAYWNPAGLTNIQNKPQIAIMHAEYFQSIAKYDFASVAIPFRNKGTLGFSIIRFSIDDILNTTQLIDPEGNIDYDRISKFSTSDYALITSYAGNFFNNKSISVGLNAKLIYRNIGKFANAFGFGIDAGLQYSTQDNFHFGIMAKDITTTFNAWSINKKELKEIEVQGEIFNSNPKETIELTFPKLQLGIAKDFEINDKFNLTSEFDLNIRFQETNDLIRMNAFSLSPSLGTEISYDNMIFVRAGLNNPQYIKNFDNSEKLSVQPNAGIGFKYKGLFIDYAITNLSKQGLGFYSNIFSLKLDLDKF